MEQDNHPKRMAWTLRKGDKPMVVFQYIVPHNQRINIMQAARDSITSGHFGSEKTIHRIVERFYLPGWEDNVKTYVISFFICVQAKASHQNRNALLQSILPSKPMELLASDLMGQYKPKSRGLNTFY